MLRLELFFDLKQKSY